MNAVAESLAVFGDLDGDLWGVVVGGEQPKAAVARVSDAAVELQPAELEREGDEVWALTSAGCDLRVERTSPSSLTAGERRLDPCVVSGSVALGGARREFEIAGVRSVAIATRGGDSLRVFAAWFAGGHEVGLLTTRPGGAKGHDRDDIDVVIRGEDHPLVVDPRLSTTYDREGAPRRVGVELWLGDDEEGDLWPRRCAGLATGSHLQMRNLSAYAFECVSRGEPGAGVYLLLQP